MSVENTIAQAISLILEMSEGSTEWNDEIDEVTGKLDSIQLVKLRVDGSGNKYLLPLDAVEEFEFFMKRIRQANGNRNKAIDAFIDKFHKFIVYKAIDPLIVKE